LNSANEKSEFGWRWERTGRDLGFVMRRIGLMTLAGGVIGVFAAFWIGRFAEALLYELRGGDPLVLTGATLVVAGMALAAGFIPAYRASRIDPCER
jgi:putative ABC transport system permease protein